MSFLKMYWRHRSQAYVAENAALLDGKQKQRLAFLFPLLRAKCPILAVSPQIGVRDLEKPMPFF